MKNIFLFVFLLLSFSFFNVYADDYKYVIDRCDLLENSTSSYISNYSKKLEDELDISFNVVIYKDTAGVDIEEYTDSIYSNVSSNDNGLLIFVSYNDRMIRVKAVGDISFFISDEVIDNYISLYFMPFLRYNEWDEGIKNGYNAFYKLISDKYNIDSSEIVILEDVDFITKFKDIIVFIVIWLNTIFSYIFCRYFINIYKKNYKLKSVDSLLFGVILLINILLLLFVYSISIIYFLFVFILELVTIYYNITSVHLDNIHKRNDKTNKKKRDICYNKKQGGMHEKKRSR